MSQGSPLSHLPIDPTNTAASSNFYIYVTDGRSWVLASLIESERHAPSAARDGGTDFARFEAGNNLALWTTASGLVGYWSFDGTGNLTNNQTLGLTDISGNNNHGTAGNPNATGMAFVPGRVGNAVTFDGVDDFVNSGLDVSWNHTNSVTWSFWVKPENTLSGQRGILGKKAPNWEWAFFQSGTNVGFVYWDTTGNHANGMDANWGSVLHAGRWVHLVYTWDRTTSRLYADGILRTIHTATNPTINQNITNSVVIGGQVRTWLPIIFFPGLIDEVRIHNRALTEAEVRANFNATRQ